MPEISRFFGVLVSMNYNDHPPPHFHAAYGNRKALISIGGPALLEGAVAPRVLGLVMEWAALHQAELEENWELAQRNEAPAKIDPLPSNAMLKDLLKFEIWTGIGCFSDLKMALKGQVDLGRLIRFDGVFCSIAGPFGVRPHDRRSRTGNDLLAEQRDKYRYQRPLCIRHGTTAARSSTRSPLGI